MATLTENPELLLTSRLDDLQRDIARLRRDLELRVSAIEQKLAPGRTSYAAAEAAADEDVRTGVTPDVIAMIAAAVTTFLGKKVKVHSARRIVEAGNPWAQQGRVFIQASHNLAR